MNCKEIITPSRNAVFSRNTWVNSHRGFRILIQMALWQDLPAHLFFKVFHSYWSYYSAHWVVYLFFMEAVSVLRNGLLSSDRTGTTRRAPRLPSAPAWWEGPAAEAAIIPFPLTLSPWGLCWLPITVQQVSLVTCTTIQQEVDYDHLSH